MEIIDSHCHLFLDQFQVGPSENGDPLAGVLERAKAIGVSAIVNVALDVESTHAVLAAFAERPWLHPTAGWHPSNAKDFQDGHAEALANLAKRPEVVAFGEIGLDYFHDDAPREVQARVLAALLEAAADSKKPVVIHCRDAWADLIKILAPARARLSGLLFHCFSGTEAEVSKAMDLDAYLSFAGPVTFPKAGDLRKALAAAPRDRIMIETDAPYLAPAPLRGKRNEPAFLTHLLKALSPVLDRSPEELAEATARNASAFFKVPGPEAGSAPRDGEPL